MGSGASDPLHQRMAAIYERHEEDALTAAESRIYGAEVALSRQHSRQTMHSGMERKSSIGAMSIDWEEDEDPESLRQEQQREQEERSMDARLRQTVEGYDDLPEADKADYRSALAIVLSGFRGSTRMTRRRRDRNEPDSTTDPPADELTEDPATAKSSSLQQLLSDTLGDEGMRAAVRGTLLQEDGACSTAFMYSAISFVLLAALLSFVLWFILAFGLTRGRAVISEFMVTFWTSQAITFLVTQPLVVFAAIAWATTFGPVVGKQCSWMPLCGASDEAQEFSGSRVLSGRVENVAMLHAVGATAGLAARDSLLVFSLTSALSTAFAQEFDKGAGAARGSGPGG